MSKMLDVDTLAKSGQCINVNGGLQINITVCDQHECKSFLPFWNSSSQPLSLAMLLLVVFLYISVGVEVEVEVEVGLITYHMSLPIMFRHVDRSSWFTQLSSCHWQP